MTHNIAVATELVENYGYRNVSPQCTIKVDIFKAFDCLDWNFLHKTLIYFDFPANVVDWIMACVTISPFSILINGIPEGFFCGKRGLR